MTRIGRGSDQRVIDIACKVVERRDKAIAIADGTEETYVSKYDGLTRKREKWFWLPLSLVEENGDGTITIPERLAQEKGLI